MTNHHCWRLGIRSDVRNHSRSRGQGFESYRRRQIFVQSLHRCSVFSFVIRLMAFLAKDVKTSKFSKFSKNAVCVQWDESEVGRVTSKSHQALSRNKRGNKSPDIQLVTEPDFVWLTMHSLHLNRDLFLREIESETRYRFADASSPSFRPQPLLSHNAIF